MRVFVSFCTALASSPFSFAIPHFLVTFTVASIAMEFWGMQTHLLIRSISLSWSNQCSFDKLYVTLSALPAILHFLIWLHWCWFAYDRVGRSTGFPITVTFLIKIWCYSFWSCLCHMRLFFFLFFLFFIIVMLKLNAYPCLIFIDRLCLFPFTLISSLSCFLPVMLFVLHFLHLIVSTTALMLFCYL